MSVLAFGPYTVFVSPGVIAQTDAAVEETLRNGSWLDVATVLPPSLGPTDVGQLLDNCVELTRDTEHKRGQVGRVACMLAAAAAFQAALSDRFKARCSHHCFLMNCPGSWLQQTAVKGAGGRIACAAQLVKLLSLRTSCSA